MQPVTVTLAGTGTSTPIYMDIRGLGGATLFVKTSGTVNYTIEQTPDNIQTVAASSVTWYNSTDSYAVSATTNLVSNFTFLPYACRLRNNSGAGTSTLTVVPQGQLG